MLARWSLITQRVSIIVKSIDRSSNVLHHETKGGLPIVYNNAFKHFLNIRALLSAHPIIFNGRRKSIHFRVRYLIMSCTSGLLFPVDLRALRSHCSNRSTYSCIPIIHITYNEWHASSSQAQNRYDVIPYLNIMSR